MFQPATKWNARIERPEVIPEIVRKAFKIAQLEKPGATHIELPDDIAASKADGRPLSGDGIEYPFPNPEAIKRGCLYYRAGKKPDYIGRKWRYPQKGSRRAKRNLQSASRSQLQIPLWAKALLIIEIPFLFYSWPSGARLDYVRL